MYSVNIKEVSKNLTAKERVSIKDTSDCLKLDKETAENGNVVIDVNYYAILEVHNDNAKDDKDYQVFVFVDKNGTKYCTGSQAMFDSFIDIFHEMENEDEEWAIKVYRLPSKNRKGKDFLTCSIC